MGNSIKRTSIPVLKLVPILAVVLVTGCASSSNVDHSQLQNGSHQLSTSAVNAGSDDAMLSRITEKADQVCGEGAYRMEGSGPAQRQALTVYRDGNYVEEVTYVMTRTVWCK